MKNKKLWIAAGALILAVCLMAGLWLLTRQASVPGGKQITITVVHGDGSQRVFSCETDEENLGEVLVSRKIAEGVAGPYGLEIHTVDGETADWNRNRSYWALYIGEEYATTGADGIMLTDGGEYRLEYTVG